MPSFLIEYWNEKPNQNVLTSFNGEYSADKITNAGLAKLTGAMLTEGTTTKTSIQISDRLADLGSRINSGTALDNSTVGMRTLATNFDASLNLLSLIHIQMCIRDSIQSYHAGSALEQSSMLKFYFTVICLMANFSKRKVPQRLSATPVLHHSKSIQMKFTFTLVFCFLLSMVQAQTKTYPNIDIPFKKFVLDNGLTLIAVSYTHLDVYKRQAERLFFLFCIRGAITLSYKKLWKCA